MIIVGDIHGQASKLLEKISSDKDYLLIGDIGFGFNTMFFPPNVVGIAGNHDSPYEIAKWDGWLGKYGYLEEHDLFYIGGAFSPDLMWRKRGKDWWIDEELTTEDFQNALHLYKKHKPKYVVSHDGPWVFTNHIGYSNNSRTQEWLQNIWEEHRPDHWFLGHYHESYNQKVMDTEFHIVGILEQINLYTLERN